MTDFATSIQSLLAKEAAEAVRNHERMGAMVEVVARALGFTVAMCARGNAEAIDEIMIGADAYAHSEAVDKAHLARFMCGIARAKK